MQTIILFLVGNIEAAKFLLVSLLFRDFIINSVQTRNMIEVK